MHTDKVEISTKQHVSEYDAKTYTQFEFVIKELYGYGKLIFNPPLVVFNTNLLFILK